jgi:rubrerythrin
MEHFATANDALDFAISEEKKAAEFYRHLATQANGPAMRMVFEQFAGEEEGHRVKLEGVKRGKTLGSSDRKIAALSATDYMVPRDTSAAMSYQDALLVVMLKEKAAYRMYTDLAAAASDATVKALLLSLAHEEANHKLRFELEYDAFVTPDN